MGHHAEGGVVVEATPGAAFKMIQPHFLLQLLVVALHAPAQLGQRTSFLSGCWAAERREVIRRAARQAPQCSRGHPMGHVARARAPLLAWHLLSRAGLAPGGHNLVLPHAGAEEAIVALDAAAMRSPPCNAKRAHVTAAHTRWCRTASSCQGRAACASRRCRRPRKVRWSS